jgi:hypothetical protein
MNRICDNKRLHFSCSLQLDEEKPVVKPETRCKILSCLAVTALTACGDSSPPVSPSQYEKPSIAYVSNTDEERRTFAAAIQTLLDVCPGIKTHWRDLKQEGAAQIRDPNDDAQRVLQWEKLVQIVLVASDDPRSIPFEYRASGHRCYYDVGVEPPFGVSISKHACVAVCQDSIPIPGRDAYRFLRPRHVPESDVPPPVLTDAQAKRLAIKMRDIIIQAHTHLGEMVSDNDFTAYHGYVMDPVSGMIDSWPDNHLTDRAIFPYDDCKQAASDFLQFSESKRRFPTQIKTGDKIWRDRSQRLMREGMAECKKAIKHPDMSLKEIQ